MKRVGIILIVVLAAGCGGGPRVGERYPAKPHGYFDVAWVEPSIVVSDSLFTLIRAERVDTVFIESRDTVAPASEAAKVGLVFRIDQASCFVSVNVVNGSGVTLAPLLARNLPSGYYKVGVNRDYLAALAAPSWDFSLVARYCGRSTQVRLTGFH